MSQCNDLDPILRLLNLQLQRQQLHPKKPE
jgi:hypothetical protein